MECITFEKENKKTKKQKNKKKTKKSLLGWKLEMAA